MRRTKSPEVIYLDGEESVSTSNPTGERIIEEPCLESRRPLFSAPISIRRHHHLPMSPEGRLSPARITRTASNCRYSSARTRSDHEYLNRLFDTSASRPIGDDSQSVVFLKTISNAPSTKGSDQRTESVSQQHFQRPRLPQTSSRNGRKRSNFPEKDSDTNGNRNHEAFSASVTQTAPKPTPLEVEVDQIEALISEVITSIAMQVRGRCRKNFKTESDQTRLKEALVKAKNGIKADRSSLREILTLFSVIDRNEAIPGVSARLKTEQEERDESQSDEDPLNMSRDTESDPDVVPVAEFNYSHLLNAPGSETAVAFVSKVEEIIEVEDTVMQNPSSVGQGKDHSVRIETPSVPASLNSLFQKKTMTPRMDNYMSMLFRTPASQPLPQEVDDNESVVCLGPPVPSKHVPSQSSDRTSFQDPRNPFRRPQQPLTAQFVGVYQSTPLYQPVHFGTPLSSPAAASSDGQVIRSSVIVPNAPQTKVPNSWDKSNQECNEYGGSNQEFNENQGSNQSNVCNPISPPRREKRGNDRSDSQYDSAKKQRLSPVDNGHHSQSLEKQTQQNSSVSSSSSQNPKNLEESDGNLKQSSKEKIRKKDSSSSTSRQDANQRSSRKSKDPVDELDPLLDDLAKSFREHVKGRCTKHWDLRKPEYARRVKGAIKGATERIRPDAGSLRTIFELFQFIDPVNFKYEIQRTHKQMEAKEKQEKQVVQLETELKALDDKLEEFNVKLIAGISKRGEKKDFAVLKEKYLQKYIEYLDVTGLGTDGPFSIDFSLTDASPYPKINSAVEKWLKEKDLKCKHGEERDNFCAPDFPTIMEIVVNAVAENKLDPKEETYAIAENIYVRTLKSYKKAREALMWNNIFEDVADGDLSKEQRKTLLGCIDTSNPPALEDQLNWNGNVARRNYQQVLDEFAARPVNEDDDGIDTEDLYDSDDEDESHSTEDPDDSDYDPEDDFINDELTQLTPLGSFFPELQARVNGHSTSRISHPTV